jgi:hypothetical protein
MMRVLCVIALCLGAIATTNGCISDDRTVEESEIVLVGGGGGQCGSNFCTGKTFCCNESCGICAPIGGGCTQQVCLRAEEPEAAAPDLEGEQASTPLADSNVVIGPIGPQPCGKNTCTGGTRCCNASCGTCVPPGFECTQQVCDAD